MADDGQGRPTVRYSNYIVTFRYTRSLYVLELQADGTPYPPKKLGFDLNHTSLQLADIVPTLQPRRVLAVLKYRKDKVVTYVLVWDLENDMEVDSIETSDEQTAIILGENGPHGYLLNSSNEVISVDRSITMTMFRVELSDFPTIEVPLLMSKREEHFVFG